MFFYIAIIVLIYVLVHALWQPFKYWKRRNIPQLKPTPLVGNFGPLLRRQCSIAELVQDIYNSHPNHRYFGAYQFFLPTLVLKDPELIKKVAVKEFDTFPEHRTVALEEVDSLLASNIFFMKGKRRRAGVMGGCYRFAGGEKWHVLRCALSPAFTSSKLKAMFALMQECAQQFVEYFENQTGVITLEMKDAFTRYTNDVIGSTAFGITCNSLKDRDNTFYAMGLQATSITLFRGLRVFMQTISPRLAKIFQLSIVPKFIETYFVNIIRESISIRKEKGIVRPDMIHLLLEARQGRLKYDDVGEDSGFAIAQESEARKSHGALKASITDEDIAAQAFSFFLAGFDTSATAMCFAAYELAVNCDIQRRLQSEIDTSLASNQGEITFEAVLGLAYLDQVVSETLRKWPPITFTDRKSVAPFTIEAKLPHEQTTHFEAGTVCWIPIYAIHRDSLYYPNPGVFDPERFHKDNLHKIKPGTYLPFGMGPKNCIGESIE
uniref:Cytochrome P450 n=1 Tax=Photinus pyralis TaxID=7054 RepID=A0A1Y1KUQ8_PHOPY